MNNTIDNYNSLFRHVPHTHSDNEDKVINILIKHYNTKTVKDLQAKQVIKEMNTHLEQMENSSFMRGRGYHMQKPFDLSETKIRNKTYYVDDFSLNTTDIVKQVIMRTHHVPFIQLEWSANKKKNQFYRKLIASFATEVQSDLDFDEKINNTNLVANEGKTSFLIKVHVSMLGSISIPPSNAHISLLVDVADENQILEYPSIKNVDAIGFTLTQDHLYHFESGQTLTQYRICENKDAHIAGILNANSGTDLYIDNSHIDLLQTILAVNSHPRERLVLHPKTVCTTSQHGRYLIELAVSCDTREIMLLTSAVFDDEVLRAEPRLTLNWLRECPFITRYTLNTTSGQIRNIIDLNRLLMDWRLVPEAGETLKYQMHLERVRELHNSRFYRSEPYNTGQYNVLLDSNILKTNQIYKHIDTQNVLFQTYDKIMKNEIELHHFWTGLYELVSENGLDLPTQLINKTKSIVSKQINGDIPLRYDFDDDGKSISFLQLLAGALNETPTNHERLANGVKLLRDSSSPLTIKTQSSEKSGHENNHMGLFKPIPRTFNSSQDESGYKDGIKVSC